MKTTTKETFRRNNPTSVRIYPAVGDYFRQPYAEASVDEDTKHCTDLILLDGTKVAVRARDSGYLTAYGNEITIRQAELRKMLTGKCHADVIFYAFYTPVTYKVVAYYVISVRKFVELITANVSRKREFCSAHCNSDDDGTGFFAFDMRQLKESILCWKKY